MPEITSRDRINRKLQEFESRLDGAISAAETIIRQQDSVSKLVATMEEEFEESTAIIDHLQRIKKEWEELKNEVAESQANAELSSQMLHEQHDQICLEFERKFNQEAEKLHQMNRASRDEHNQYVEQSRAHAYGIAQSIETANNSVNRAEELLVNVKDDLRSEIDDRLNRNEMLIGNVLEKLENQWNDKVCELERQITNEIDAFKKESDDSLKSHLRKVEENITEFLGKQNVLIQNLSQQIDGFSRQMQTFSVVQQVADQKLVLLEKRLDKISTDEVIIQTMRNDMQALATRLEQTINRLQGLRFVGGSFRDL